MLTLFENCPQALAYCESVIDGIDDYLLFPNERFHSLVVGIISTSGVDLSGEQVVPEALTSMAAALREDPVWMMVEHNPLIQPTGRIVAADVFFSEPDQMHILAGVIGYYDPASIPSFAQMGVDTTKVASVDHFIRTEPLLSPQLQIGFNPHEIAPRAIQEILADAPAIVDRQPRQIVRKAADPISILELFATIWLLTQNPFSKAFLERLGSKSADGLIDLGKWAGRKLLPLLTSTPKIKLLEFTTVIGECKVEFVVSSTNARDLQAALDSLHEAALSSMSLVAQLARWKPRKLTYIFDPKLQTWQPKHAATKLAGVISDEPVDIDLSKYKALSIGGEITEPGEE